MLKFAKSLWSPAKSSTSLSASKRHTHGSHALALSSLLMISLLTSACGFSPLYATNNVGNSIIVELAAISVHAPGDSLNRTIRLSLEDLLHTDGSMAAKYQVHLTSNLSVRDVAVQQDTSVTRKNLVLTSTYTLLDLENGETLLQSRATAIAAYNRVGSEFANIIAERDARARAANQAATQIQTELAIFFERRNGS